MSQATALEFQRKFGEFQHQAQREPVEITRHGRCELVLMSADHYDWLLAAAQRTHRTTDTAPVVVAAVRRAEMDPEHAGLDDLLKSGDPVALPNPRPGLVFRYDYLWPHEAAKGRDQGKERPACLVAAMDSGVSPRFVVILPITDTPPKGDTIGVEIPAKVRQAIGLDDAPSWVIVSDHNVDAWPNAGLAPVPGKSGVVSYGFIPPGLFAPVKAGFLEAAQPGLNPGVNR